MLSKTLNISLDNLKVNKTLILRACRTLSMQQSVKFRSYNNHHNSAPSTMVSIESILAGKYPAKAHARKVAEYIKKSKPDAQGVLYLEGQKTRMIEDNDEAQPFR
jgi:hypothetical protein